jgi:hypothetical protein
MRPISQIETTVQPADFACVLVRGPVGFGIALGEFLDGSRGWTGFRHVLGYMGWHQRPPEAWQAQWVVFDQAGSKTPVGGQTAGHWVFEAHPDGARFRLLEGKPEDIPGCLWSTGYFGVTPQQRQVAMTMIPHSLQGLPYSAADYFALAAHRLHAPFSPLLKNYVADSGHMICSQLIDQVYAWLDIHLFDDGRWPGYVDPWDLADLILKKKGMTSKAWRECLKQCP